MCLLKHFLLIFIIMKVKALLCHKGEYLFILSQYPCCLSFRLTVFIQSIESVVQNSLEKSAREFLNIFHFQTILNHCRLQYYSCLLIINVFYASESFQEKKTVTVSSSVWHKCGFPLRSPEISSEERILFIPWGHLHYLYGNQRIKVIVSSSRVIIFTFLDIHVIFFEKYNEA